MTTLLVETGHESTHKADTRARHVEADIVSAVDRILRLRAARERDPLAARL